MNKPLLELMNDAHVYLYVGTVWGVLEMYFTKSDVEEMLELLDDGGEVIDLSEREKSGYYFRWDNIYYRDGNGLDEIILERITE